MAYTDFDVMQVCKNGHRINASSVDYPQFNKAFCSDCGAATITACPACHAPIKGAERNSSVISLTGPKVPSYCDSCGHAYPWQEAKLANAIELLELQGVADDAISQVKQNLPDIARDTPRSQVAASRIVAALKKSGKPIYDVCIKVISDVASASAKQHLGL